MVSLENIKLISLRKQASKKKKKNAPFNSFCNIAI